jgi:hypothetical protein
VFGDIGLGLDRECERRRVVEVFILGWGREREGVELRFGEGFGLGIGACSVD